MAVHDVNGIHTSVRLEDVLIKKPFRMQIIGASGSGKSTWLLRLIKFRKTVTLGKDFDKIIYVYGGDSMYTRGFITELKAQFPGAEYYKGMVDIAVDDKLGDTLLIYDDLHTEVYNSDAMRQLFSVQSRHHNVSVCVTQHAGFPGGKHYGNIEINFTHRVILSSNEFIKAGIFSRKVVGKPKVLKQILGFLKKEFRHVEQFPYVMVSALPRNEYDALTVYSLLFPRVGPDGNEFIAPIFFVPDGEDLPTKE